MDVKQALPLLYIETTTFCSDQSKVLRLQANTSAEARAAKKAKLLQNKEDSLLGTALEAVGFRGQAVVVQHISEQIGEFILQLSIAGSSDSFGDEFQFAGGPGENFFGSLRRQKKLCGYETDVDPCDDFCRV